MSNTVKRFIWHPKEEMPRDRNILVISVDRTIKLLDGYDSAYWPDVDTWCYVDDLIQAAFYVEADWASDPTYDPVTDCPEVFSFDASHGQYHATGIYHYRPGGRSYGYYVFDNNNRILSQNDCFVTIEDARGDAERSIKELIAEVD